MENTSEDMAHDQDQNVSLGEQTATASIEPGYVVSNQQYIYQGPMFNPPNYVQGNPNYPQYDIIYAQPSPAYQQNVRNKYWLYYK